MRLQPDSFRKRLFKGYFPGMSSTGFFMCMIMSLVFMVMSLVFMVMPLMIVIMSFFMLVSFVFVLSVSRSIPTATR